MTSALVEVILACPAAGGACPPLPRFVPRPTPHLSCLWSAMLPPSAAAARIAPGLPGGTAVTSLPVGERWALRACSLICSGTSSSSSLAAGVTWPDAAPVPALWVDSFASGLACGADNEAGGISEEAACCTGTSSADNGAWPSLSLLPVLLPTTASLACTSAGC